MEERLELVLKKEQLSRIRFEQAELTVDLHGMCQSECRWLVRTMIAIIFTDFQLNLIHGYNHGTKLKEMLLATNLSDRVTDMYCDPWNPGMTHMHIAQRA